VRKEEGKRGSRFFSSPASRGSQHTNEWGRFLLLKRGKKERKRNIGPHSLALESQALGRKKKEDSLVYDTPLFSLIGKGGGEKGKEKNAISRQANSAFVQLQKGGKRTRKICRQPRPSDFTSSSTKKRKKRETNARTCLLAGSEKSATLNQKTKGRQPDPRHRSTFSPSE